jgi:response regulator RpfG family c-di-GMP phosphodiesterase
MIKNEVTKVFYIDDDQDDLDFFKYATDEIGESVKLFSLPDEMIRTLHNPPPLPSVVFLDLNMPLKTGFDILKELKASEAFKLLPLIVYSTSGNSETIRQCRKLGASMYIEKPSTTEELKTAIKFVLAKDWEKFPTTDENFKYKQK